MPHKSEYIGRGFSGTKGREKLRGEVLAMRDRAKLERKVAKKQKTIRDGGKLKPVSERHMDRYRSKERVVKRLMGKVAEMRSKADDVDRSGTGNKKAAATYRQVAGEYQNRITALRAKGK